MVQCPKPDPNATSATAAPSSRDRLQLSDFLHIMITAASHNDTYYPMPHHRAWRELGISAIVVTDEPELKVAEINARFADEAELWLHEVPTPSKHRPWILRAATAPFIVQRTPLRRSFKWLFYGDDDTFVNFYALKHILEDWDYNLPYIVSDAFMQLPATPAVNDTRDTYSGGSTPRCLPCHLQPHPMLGEVLKVPGRGGFTPPVGCPCTTELACSQRPRPDFPHLGNDTEACMRGLTWPKGGHGGFSGFFGGSGFAVSRGLFKFWPFSNTTALLELMHEHLETNGWPGGDMFLSSFLGKIGTWFTDPGTYWWTGGEALHASSFGAKQRMGGSIDRWSTQMLEGRCTQENGCLHDFLSAVSQHKAPFDHRLLTDAWRRHHATRGAAAGGPGKPRHQRERRLRRRRTAS